ncbi:hypothetical protein UFOVP647_20 [uncultured Caudovirales phage]|uniref:Uncharacterized protein n=1 Tax=uncultured Caudovirales phage TaxID=2100421 RepID=A0A6J5N6F0_9CAUD|nr:hypothetical protein UFOVP647_20 [uncultured Caudovirales phage]
MPFIISNSVTTSFAEYQDVLDTDARVFDSNEGLTDEVVETSLTKSTQRILTILRNTDWWKTMYMDQTPGFSPSTVADIPALDPSKIKARQDDFTDLCVMYSLYYYLLPKVADFSNQDSAERAKIGFYQSKFEALLQEIITAGDWYDFDGDATVESSEKRPGKYSLKRVR